MCIDTCHMWPRSAGPRRNLHAGGRRTVEVVRFPADNLGEESARKEHEARFDKLAQHCRRSTMEAAPFKGFGLPTGREDGKTTSLETRVRYGRVVHLKVDWASEPVRACAVPAPEPARHTLAAQMNSLPMAADERWGSQELKERAFLYCFLCEEIVGKEFRHLDEETQAWAGHELQGGGA